MTDEESHPRQLNESGSDTKLSDGFADGQNWTEEQELKSIVIRRIFQWAYQATECIQQEDKLWAERFTILEQLGEGAHGRIFRAIDQRQGQQEVALKLPYFEHDDETMGFRPPSSRKCKSVQRWITEFSLHKRLGKTHTGLAPVLDCAIPESSNFETVFQFLGDDPIWLTMPVFRLTLSDYLAEQGGKLTVSEARRIMLSIASSLQHIHEFKTDIVHCDLKPSNVLMDVCGNPLIADFGLATNRDEQSFNGNLVAGTVSYMAPEQYRGEAVTHATDIWAWGAMFYKLLSGRLPFQGSLSEWQLWIASDVPPTSLANQEGVPVYLANIVGRCLKKSLDSRYGSIQEVLQAFGDSEDDLHGPPTRQPTGESRLHNDSSESLEYSSELSDFLNDDRKFLWWGMIDPGCSWRHRKFQELVEVRGEKCHWRLAYLRQDDTTQTEQWFRNTSHSWRPPIATLLIVEAPVHFEEPLAICMLNLADQAATRFGMIPRVRLLLCCDLSVTPDLRQRGDSERSVRIRSHLFRNDGFHQTSPPKHPQKWIDARIYGDRADFWQTYSPLGSTENSIQQRHNPSSSPAASTYVLDEATHITRLVQAINVGDISRLASIQRGTPRIASEVLEALSSLVDLLVELNIHLTAGNIATSHSLVERLASILAEISETYETNNVAMRPLLVAFIQNVVRSQGGKSSVSRALRDSISSFAIRVKDDELTRTLKRTDGDRA